MRYSQDIRCLSASQPWETEQRNFLFYFIKTPLFWSLLAPTSVEPGSFRCTRERSSSWLFYNLTPRHYLLDDVMLDTNMLSTQHAVDWSLHPAVPAAQSLVLHPPWVSAQGMRRASSPTRSGPVCRHPSLGMSASARWCWSGAWPPLLGVRCPKVTGQPYYNDVRPGTAQRGTMAMLLCEQWWLAYPMSNQKQAQTMQSADLSQLHYRLHSLQL